MPQRGERLPPGTGPLIQTFLALNRRRIRPNPPLGSRELERWNELRWKLEELLGGGAHVGERVRRALRVPTHLPVRVAERGETAAAREIAEAGIFLATAAPAPVGTPLHLKIQGECGETVAVKGVVAWVRDSDSPKGPAGMGVRFDELDVAQFEAVAELVQQALSAL